MRCELTLFHLCQPTLSQIALAVPTRRGRCAGPCKHRAACESRGAFSREILGACKCGCGSRAKTFRCATAWLKRVQRGAVRARNGAKWFRARARRNFSKASRGGKSCGSECGQARPTRRIRRSVSLHATTNTRNKGVLWHGRFCQHRLGPRLRECRSCLGLAHRVSRNRTVRSTRRRRGA